MEVLSRGTQELAQSQPNVSLQLERCLEATDELLSLSHRLVEKLTPFLIPESQCVERTKGAETSNKERVSPFADTLESNSTKLYLTASVLKNILSRCDF